MSWRRVELLSRSGRFGVYGRLRAVRDSLYTLSSLVGLISPVLFLIQSVLEYRSLHSTYALLMFIWRYGLLCANVRTDVAYDPHPATLGVIEGWNRKCGVIKAKVEAMRESKR